MSAKMAQSGSWPNAPPLAMRAMTEDWTPPPRLMTVREWRTASAFVLDGVVL